MKIVLELAIPGAGFLDRRTGSAGSGLLPTMTWLEMARRRSRAVLEGIIPNAEFSIVEKIWITPQDKSRRQANKK